MDGLECSERLFSIVSSNSGSFRIDSHYFQKNYWLLREKLESKPHWLIRDIVTKPVQTGHTPSMSNGSYYGGSIKLIKTDNLHQNEISGPYTDHLSESGNAKIGKTKLEANDIIVTIIGATEDIIARSALVMPHHLPANINQNIAQIRIDENIAAPEYVNAYLNCFYGRTYFRFLSRQTEQVNLNCQEVGSVLVPAFSDRFQRAIQRCIRAANALQQRSADSFAATEAAFLERIKISLAKLSQDNVSVRSLSKSFLDTGRLDAEYYQPKYDDLHTLLQAFPTSHLGGADGIVTISKSIEPGSEYYGDTGIPFIRVSDISKTGIAAPSVKIPKTIVPSIETLYPKKDTILFSKDGSVGIAFKVEDDMQAVTSGALLHLRIKDTGKILPDYLTLVLNSPIVQLQAERDTSGAIIQHWKTGDVEDVIVPILPYDVQAKISEEVQASFSSRRRSKQLTDAAVRAVEIAIEQDEATAAVWLENKAGSIMGTE